ncbi:hypothetical protein BAUCODRAFT_77530 [Baudoinia panamericana UAMH 10762]|uniref:Uncharacterized protein n=1 Tax=Baudoinia panamericana (strain UAMH 10762) TaxID=717646 RepID=M2N1Y0_BAUPA|nr:uncharacterized protein BAUCODRAFT_77530 [Baudoinia panamericana UAMH 10762]EMC92979.1 hypothetical protein BAUCODRAFT_77530 [Baudoinia panamericana UAMH 10762]
MRLRRPSPLLLLLLATFAYADLDSPRSGRLQKRDSERLTKEEILALNTVPGEPIGRSKGQLNVAVPAEPEAAVVDSIDTTATQQSSKATSSGRPYVGTEDAPVDGMDGKPHAGPFVDTTPDESTKQKGDAKAKTSSAKPTPTSLEKFKSGASSNEGWKLADIPEKIDSVMNDEKRPVPKEGTRGTEGGISEKTNQQKAQGGNAEKKPQEPKEAPPLPHSEQEIKDVKKDSKADSKEAKDAAAADAAAMKDTENAVVGAGLGKPTDLPDKPHNIPHPDPKGGSKPSAMDGKTNPKKAPTSSDSITGGGDGAEMEWHEWFHSFVLSLTMILFSEIGDKTFLVAALMAMRHPRLIVFSAALSALVAMTILSAVLGHAVPTLLPKRFTTFLAAVLFLVFGARMLREGLAMPATAGVGEEMREVEAELEEKEHSLARRASRHGSVSPYALESGKLPSPSPSPSRDTSPSRTPRDRFAGLSNLLGLILSPAWVQTFIMTFLGEWGDRSQIATIAMAAGQDYWWVTLGAITGHAICTGIAVLGGRALAGRVSMRVVTIGGALAFLAFGLIYIYECLVER